MPSPPTFDLLNLLLGLAWLGELDREQIGRLWFPEQSVSTVEKTLAELCKQGLIQKRSWSRRDTVRNVTIPQLARWSLTQSGHAQIKGRDQYPIKPSQPRQKRLIEHDARTTATIVRLIELARPRDLSGVAIVHELRLHPERRRPIMDALIIFQLHGGFNQPHLVPWSRDLPTEDERLFRFAIEADNNTEPPEVLRGKARAYRTINSDGEWLGWWREHYGPPPLPIWVAPDSERARTIHTHWKATWPEGMWYITDDWGLRQNSWLKYHAGQDEPIIVVFPAPRRALPPPPPPASMPPPLPPPPAPAATPPAPAESTATPGASGQSIVQSLAPRLHPRVLPPTAADYALAAAAHRQPTLPEQLHEVSSALPRRALARLVSTSLACALLVGVLVVGGWLVEAASSRWQTFIASRTTPSATSMPMSIPSTPTAEVVAPAFCSQARVTARRVNVREAPTRQSAVLRQVQQGDVVKLLCDAPEDADGYTWQHVQLAEGIQEGWIATKYLALVP